MSRFVSYTTGRMGGWGHLDGDTITDLTAHFPTMRAAIEAGALAALAQAAGPKLGLDQVTLTIPVTNPEKIICVGVNYPDRNAEYKDGQDAPPNMSLFIRFPRSFTGHDQPLIRPPESPQLDYEGEVVIVEEDRTVSIKAGESFIIPKGLRCRWTQPGHVKKFFVIFDDASGLVNEGPLHTIKIDPAVKLAPSTPPAAAKA